MVCGLFDSGWNFGIDFLKIENERPPPPRRERSGDVS